MKSHLKLVTPNTKNRTATPKRKSNADLRSREYLTDAEVELLTEAAKAMLGPSGCDHGALYGSLCVVLVGLGIAENRPTPRRPDPVGDPESAF